MRRLVLAFAAAGACALMAQAIAADLYKWTDDKGRTHLSDRVPEEYKHKAIRIDPKQFELTPQQRAEAEARAARDKKYADERKAAEERAALAAAAAASAASAAAAAAGPASGQRAAAREPETECQRMRRMYDESQACFTAFRNSNGSIRPEAYSQCLERPDPTKQCGPGPAK